MTTALRAPVRPVVRQQPRDGDAASEVPASILAAIAAGAAASRADLARLLHIAPSTVTARVGELVAAGVLRDAGLGEATGGRRARVLRLAHGAGSLIAISIGRDAGRVGVLDLTGSLVAAADVPLDTALPVEAVLDGLLEPAVALVGRTGAGPVRGVGVSVPGPVDVRRGAVDRAAALPGWHGRPIGDLVRARTGAPVAVENDANAMALGEHAQRVGRADGGWAGRTVLQVKADATIGCGLVVDGRLFRGATALTGDVAHVRVPEAGDAVCGCGRRGCLESVAGAAGIAAALTAAGVPAGTTADVVRLARAGQQDAVRLVGASGALLGGALAAVVNFVSPHVLALGGPLAGCDAFALGVRRALSSRCHPLATQALTIERTVLGADAELVGAGRLVLRRALSAL